VLFIPRYLIRRNTLSNRFSNVQTFVAGSGVIAAAWIALPNNESTENNPNFGTGFVL